MTRDKVEKRGEYDILVMPLGCRPATDSEVEFWNRIQELDQEVERLRAVAEEAVTIAFGLDETCGKFPELERKLEAAGYGHDERSGDEG